MTLSIPKLEGKLNGKNIRCLFEMLFKYLDFQHNFDLKDIDCKKNEKSTKILQNL